MTTERGELEVELAQDDGEISTVNVQSFVDEQEWNLHKHINSWTRIASTNVYKSSQHKHPALSISCTATRRSRFFIWNIILVMVRIFIHTVIWYAYKQNSVCDKSVKNGSLYEMFSENAG